jgi:hypothetical protein
MKGFFATIIIASAAGQAMAVDEVLWCRGKHNGGDPVMSQAPCLAADGRDFDIDVSVGLTLQTSAS